MTAPHYRDAVFQAESLQCPVGFTILQYHVEVALLMRRLRIRQAQFGHLFVLFLILHHHFVVEAFGGGVIVEMHRVVVHAGHREAPLHLLVIGELTGIVGREEVCI